MDVEGAYWQPYRFPFDNATNEVPSHAIETAKEMARLNQIILETINVYCGSRGRVTAPSILQLYRKYLQWKQTLPPAMQIDYDAYPSLPHVYFLHAHYHVALCQLFQPLLNYHQFSRTTLEHVRSITIQAAQDGVKVLRAHRQLFSGRYQTPLQAFCTIHLCDTVIRCRQSDTDAQEAVEFCLQTLHDALPGFVFVGPLQAMFCQTVLDQHLLLPKEVNKLMGGRTQYGPEELLDACERVTYMQPVELLLERLDPLIADSFEREWQNFIEEHGAAIDEHVIERTREETDEKFRQRQSVQDSPSNRSMQIDSIVNP